MILLAALVLTASPAIAQKGNKPGRGGSPGSRPVGGMQEDGRDRRDYELGALLPSGYQHLRNEDVRELEQLVRGTLGWIRGTAAPNAGFRSSTDLFQPSAESDDSAAVEVRGLQILSLLNLDQRKTLAASLDDYRRLSSSRDEPVMKLTELIAVLRSHESAAPLRKLDADSRRFLQEIAGIDSELGTLQARTFLKIARSLDNQQSEAIVLAIRGPGVPGTATPEMQIVQTELRGTSADAARDLQEMGVSFAEWLAPPAAEVAGRHPPAADVRRGGGRDRTVDSAVIEFLTALGSHQQELMLQLLASSGRRRIEAAEATAALQTALRPGPERRAPDERFVRGLAQRRTQAVFSAAADNARGFEAIRRTLSDAQKKHLKLEDVDKTKQKKTGGA